MALASRFSSLQLWESFPELDQGPLRLTDFAKTLCSNSKVTLCSAATFWCCVSQLGSHEALVFKPLQCGIHTADSGFTSAPFFKLAGDRHAIRVFAEADQSQHHHQFKIAEIVSLRHLFNYSE